MAILFGRVSNVSRGSGGSAVKAAAYRSCSSLTLNTTDQETNITVPLTWDYTKKSGLVYSQIHAPENAPEWAYDRQTLWQRVEDVETKQNARLAGEYTMALPKELTVDQNIELLKEFVEEVFVSRGIIVDVNFHNDNPNNPHAHCMYALRELEQMLEGEVDFSPHRFRELQSRAFLDGVIKEAHKNVQNAYLEKNGFDQRLEWGVVKGQEATIHHGGMAELSARNEQIILKNAEKIVANPTIVIDKLDFNKAVFSKEDIAKELEKALLTTLKNVDTTDESAFNTYIKSELIGLLDSVLLSPKLTLVNSCDLKGNMLFAKTEQVKLEQRFIGQIEELAKKQEHAISLTEKDIAPYALGKEFSAQQKKAIIDICGGSDLSVLEGWPGAGKSTVTKEIARHYQEAGYEIVAVAPTNKAAQELEAKLGVKVYTTAALRMKWQYNRGASKVSVGLGTEYYKEELYSLKEGALEKKTLFILDEASMLDVANSDYFVSEIRKSGSKMLALGDNNQNQAIGSKGSFARMGEAGNRNILTEVNRHQNTDLEIKALHIKATSALCNYNVATALSIYGQLGKINVLANEQEKRVAIARSYVAKIMSIAKTESISLDAAAKQVVISSYTNEEITHLNNLIRDSLKISGALVGGNAFRSGGIHGKSSMVDLAVGDRIIFTRNLRKKEGVGGVLNNEMGTITKLLEVDNMGVGEFLVDVEGASGVRSALIRTGEDGRIATFKHGYAVTNHAVQGASVPYKLYSVDQYSGYSSVLVGLTRHKKDCEIFAAQDTLENEVYKTKDLDVEKVREEYKAIGYTYETKLDDDNNEVEVRVDIPLWKLGLHLLASKRSDISFAIDASYGHSSVDLQKSLNAHREQLEGLRQNLNKDEDALSKFELAANTILQTEKQDKSKNKDRTQFEQLVSQHFVLKEDITFEIKNVISAPDDFKVRNIDAEGKYLKIDDHLRALKAGVISDGNNTRLDWSALSEQDQDLVLWSYIDEDSRKNLTSHYSNVRSLTEEITDKAAAASSIWEELKESGFESHESLTGNFKIVKEYIAARLRVKESFDQSQKFDGILMSAKIQKMLIAEIAEKYSIKLKFISVSTSGLSKAETNFLTKKEEMDEEQLEKDKNYKAIPLEEFRVAYLKSLKGKEFLEILNNSNLFVNDVLASAKENSELGKLTKVIKEAAKEESAAKEERLRTAGIMFENWHGHIDAECSKTQPIFSNILNQLNVNYHTLSKHAGVTQEKHYFENLVNGSLGKNNNYQNIMSAIHKVQTRDLTTNEVIELIKAHDGLCEQVELVNEYTEELKNIRSKLKDTLNVGKSRLKEIETYQKTELPYFFSTIYKEDSATIRRNLDEILSKTEDKGQLYNVINHSPEMLGSLKARGLVSKIFNNNESQNVDANLKKLGSRIKEYTKGKDEMQQLKQVTDVSYSKRITDIDKQIGVLQATLPSSSQFKILEEIGELQNSSLKDADQEKNIITLTQKINKFLASDQAQDSLFAYQSKHNVFFKEIAAEVTKAEVANPAVIGAAISPEKQLRKQISQKAARDKSQMENLKQKNSKPSLTFAEVRAAVNASVAEGIFRTYAQHINPDDKVIKNGYRIKVGSLNMSLQGDKVGLWQRFSASGSKGDIFSFVEEARSCSKFEALEIVASHAGVIATVKDNNSFSNTRAIANNKNAIHDNVNRVNKNKDEWIAKSIVTESDPAFKQNKDLFFIKKNGGKITHTHEYRNKDNQLLGYAVRVEEIASGKKQVLPVAYCHNEAKNKSRWKLKGFSDNGRKPIYRAEKLAQQPNKPVLIVEGEKTADAAQRLLPNHTVISWMGGAQGVNNVDWSLLKDKMVTIWPDNDKPGKEAAHNISSQIDQHNGFSGLVSTIDTSSLNLPEKWDLADKLPKHLAGKSVPELLKQNAITMEKTITANLAVQPDENIQQALGAIDILEAQGRIDQDEYFCKKTYHATLAAIAANKNINLQSAPKEFVDNIRNLQSEYNDLQRTYEANNTKAANIQDQSPDAKTTLENQLVANTSVLQMALLNKPSLTEAHTKHIQASAKAATQNLKQFADSDKEHAASNMHKQVSSKEWRIGLENNQQNKAAGIKLKFTAKTIDEFLVGSGHQDAHTQLKHIRKYGIDESTIMQGFKENHANGTKALAATSAALSTAATTMEENRSIINESRQWGNKSNDIDVTKHLFKNPNLNPTIYLKDVRNNQLEHYFRKNIMDFDAKKSTIHYEEQKVFIAEEQRFLQKTFESLNTNKGLREYGNNSILLTAGQEMSKNPQKLDKFFKQCEIIQSDNIESKRGLFNLVLSSRNIERLSRSAGTTIERHHLKTIPAELAANRQEATSIDEALHSIEKEQNKLADLHGNIKYLTFEKNLLDKCALAHNQREANSLGGLKNIAQQSLESGAKTKEQLLDELREVTDPKIAHTEFDKDIEAHHINNTFKQSSEQKQASKSPEEILKIITKEQEFLSGLHNNIKYPEEHQALLPKCELAHKQENEKIIDKLKTTARLSLENGVKTKEQLIADLKEVTDLKEAHTEFDKDIETHHINNTLEQSSAQKQASKSSEEILHIISKEHEFFSGLHNNIKYPENHQDTLNKCKLAHDQKEENTLGAFKEIAQQSLKSGAKTEEQLVADLKKVTDLKEAHTKLDQDIEVHHINSNLNSLTKAKQAATNTKEAMHAITKEQEFLSGLHNNIKHPEQHNAELIDSVNNAHKLQQGSAMHDLHKATQIIEASKFSQYHSVAAIIKKCNDPIDAQNTLTKSYQDHFVNQVHQSLKIIDKKGHIHLDNQKFDCPIKFIEHVITNRTHEYVPQKQLQQIHTQTVEHHKALEMSKDMGGPCM